MARWKKVARAKEKFKRIFDNRRQTLLVHYSCESFVENTKGSHKVTSIAVRFFDSAQTRSFSIFQCAEELGIKSLESDIDFQKAETKLLNDFFDFVSKHTKHLWVHWNMRDINYGFAALEHRHKALGGSPIVIDDDDKIDLSRVLYERYSKHYVGHPRMYNLVKLNQITDKNMLNGEEESQAFQKGDYLKLHQSTLRKVDIFDAILNCIEEDNLKVNSNLFQQYGNTIVGAGYWVKENPVFALIALIASLVTIGGCVAGM